MPANGDEGLFLQGGPYGELDVSVLPSLDQVNEEIGVGPQIEPEVLVLTGTLQELGLPEGGGEAGLPLGEEEKVFYFEDN